MKNRKKLIALLAVALLIPMSVLAATCAHKYWGSTYDVVRYIPDKGVAGHTKLIQHLHDCQECGQTAAASPATSLLEGHTREVIDVSNKRYSEPLPNSHKVTVTRKFRCRVCGFNNFAPEDYSYHEPHHYVRIGTRRWGLLDVDVYKCTGCGKIE